MGERGGGKPGDKPALFLKGNSRPGFGCFDLERWQMDLSWLLSRHGGEKQVSGALGGPRSICAW